MTTPRRASSDELQALWKRYSVSADPRLRDRLVLTLAPLVKFIVYRKVREMPAHAEAEDFISVGLEALIQSIDRYDPGKGATLEQYAWTRVHGAVLDELRRQDWAPRSVRRWERDIEKAVEEFTALHTRRPTREELAEALGITVAELRRHRTDIAQSDVTSLNAVVLTDDSSTAIEQVDTLASSDDRLDPEHATGRTMAKERFRDAFGRLPEREREIAVLLYVKNLTLSEIGDVLGVSESRVCQIHGQTKRKLRAALDEDAALFHLVA
ncbi:MAG TPA: FliA/WhiG family RNA polymerase sigma factor [Solirubrobacteraceae bacterium]|jgi:RNA polymerase sigma factor for flagellar operon FliA|nr:FliA/WhiG family RNA polymerase sigma factor [Solirubrobacteraceae bacterium]